ncbi:MAG: helix-turn-helix transcriptional regulator [Actinomycetia bacterium]|nr:helix-turn-helix transcriptional regulator [Actinomycetes bacterium]
MEVETRPFTARVNRPALRMAVRFNRMTYRDLAFRAKVSKSTIGNLLSGQAKTCNPETAAKIAEALALPTAEIFVLEPIGDRQAVNARAA